MVAHSDERIIEGDRDEAVERRALMEALCDLPERDEGEAPARDRFELRAEQLGGQVVVRLVRGIDADVVVAEDRRTVAAAGKRTTGQRASGADESVTLPGHLQHDVSVDLRTVRLELPGSL